MEHEAAGAVQVRKSAASFAEQVARLQATLVGSGVSIADMRQAQSLEMQYAGSAGVGQSPSRLGPVDIERLEGPIAARKIPEVPRGSSRLRYFLDGSQRTFPVWRIGVIPIAATIAVAGILQRDAAGRAALAAGTLRLSHAWLVPRRSSRPDVQSLVTLLEGQGITVVDPLDQCEDDAEYELQCGNYGRMVELAYARAMRVRTELERELIGYWRDDLGPAAKDDWLVVDGRLGPDAPPRAIGLVKDLQTQHLAGREAEALFSLPPGYRTTAFHHRARRDQQPSDSEPDQTTSTASTLWYLRLWDSEGMDARHALVRVEAGTEVRDAAQIDQLSAWLMTERTPRATADARWATLLYPVHFLEQILKRRVAADIRGWPGARAS